MSALRPPLLSFLALLALSACQCGQPPVDPTVACQAIPGNQPGHPQTCGEGDVCGEHYSCRDVADSPGLRCCLFTERACNSEKDCCPGQSCPADAKKCYDRFLACDTDADCGDKGDRTCEVWQDGFGASNRCRLAQCDALGQCPSGQSCFNGECLADLPCGGSCEPGTACIPSASLDRCQQLDCPTSCAPGFLATVKDARDIWDTCQLDAVVCECRELPALRSNDLGRHSAIAALAEEKKLLVSTYDGQYGDLVVQQFGADGKLEETTWVDGIPEGAPVRWGPSGPRGGMVEAGPDVGRDTDVATAGRRAYVSYYDASQGDLKLAVRGEDGSWSSFSLDGADADVGRYTSVAVDAEGRVGISYFQRGASSGFDASACPGTPPAGDPAFLTALKFARSRGPAPSSAADFDIVTVACQARPPPACHACDGVCVDPGTGAGCYPTASGCSACDPNSESCVQVDGEARCAPRTHVTPLAEVVDGVGLFSSLAFVGTDAHIAYMRRTGGDGDLYGVRVRGTLQPGTPVALDTEGDTGFFPDLKVAPGSGQLAVAYHDFTSHHLKLYLGGSFTAGVTPEVIDDGGEGGQWSYAGTDSALVLLPSGGGMFAVYQDATTGDLELASRRSGWERLQPMRESGAVGFFADAVLMDGTLYASHARLHARTVGGEAQVDNTLLLDRYQVQ